MSDGRVIYMLPDKMGGQLNIIASLLRHRGDDAMPHDVVLTHNRLDVDTRFAGPLSADRRIAFEYALPLENIHAVLRRLRQTIPDGGGVLVSNDLLELAMLHRHDPGMMVMQILHGDHAYYYDLAARHQSVIDVFAAYSRAMYDGLRARLPHRTDDILYLPYGVPLPSRRRQPVAGPLRLLFAGRIEHGQKGVFDLPLIDAELRRRHVDVAWTVIGAGPHDAELRARWVGAQVTLAGPLLHADLLEALPNYDVFVLPTRAEGFPVALVEAMATGLVPVVSDIRSGVPEVVEDGVSGFRPAVGDIAGFSDAIAILDNDRARLEAMSRAAHERIASNFDAAQRAAAYQDVYRQWRQRRRSGGPAAPLPYGSRLDQPWMPNVAVRGIRSMVRHLQGKPV